MRTFQEHVAATGIGSVNTIFETGMHALINELEKIVAVFQAAGAPFEIIGGVAVNAHLLPRHRSRSFLTRDIDLLVRRSDLDRVALEARTAGYEARKIVGGYMLRLPNQQAEEAIHLFSSARSRNQPS